MSRTWDLQQAQNELGQVIENALSQGPQFVTRNGAKIAVVLSYAKYRRLVTSRESLSAFFRRSPLTGVDLDLSRDKSDP
jgi:antitoxin Phd